MYKQSMIKGLQVWAVFLLPVAAWAHPGGVLHDVMHGLGVTIILLAAAVVVPVLCRLAARPARPAERATRRPGPG